MAARQQFTALALVLACNGCTLGAFGPTTTVVTVETWRFRQAGLLPAPQGPLTSGDGGRPGQVLLEAGLSRSWVQPTANTRDGGAAGVVYQQTLGQARVAWTSPTRWQIGLTSAFGMVESAVAVPADLQAFQSVPQQSTFRSGLTLRKTILISGQSGIAWQSEIAIGNVPWRRETTVDSNSTATRTWPAEEPGQAGRQKVWTFDATSTAQTSGTQMVSQGGSSLSAVLELAEDVVLDLGGFLHWVPVWAGTDTATRTCVNNVCPGLDQPDVPMYKTAMVATPFAALSVRSGRFGCVGRAWWHAGSENVAPLAAQFGAGLAGNLDF